MAFAARDSRPADNLTKHTPIMNERSFPNHPLPTAPYLEQAAQWPTQGEHVLAHYDDQSIVVYQAYKPSIAAYAVAHGRLGGPEFSFARMSWIKPNFLWMMYRCGWATKSDQERVLGLRLRRPCFDAWLARAVPSSFGTARQAFASHEAWAGAVANSDVRLQWDPDHTPSGSKSARRAVQLGLRGAALRDLADAAALEVIDMTDFVARQRPFARDDSPDLHTPVERVYPLPQEPSR